MTRFVLDCSVTMGWCFDDEADEYSVGVLSQLADSEAVVPGIWPLEVVNVLLHAERRQRLTQAAAATFLNLLEGLPIQVFDVGTPIRGELLALGRGTGLSSYDAAYLLLAERSGLPLATRDAQLRKAAKRVGVDLLAP